jgi:glycosyltransferase involved in cell wall biosynthesis
MTLQEKIAPDATTEIDLQLTILMPCLNEAETIEVCIQKAHQGAAGAGIDAYEIVVADNGSTDGSQILARDAGARVVDVPVRGYGAALKAGIEAARGQYIIMGDSDDSYDFANIKPFTDKLDDGYSLVMGSRFKGEIKPGAMPFLHRYLGNPLLTFIGNLFFKCGLSDFHCGIRAFRRDDMLALGLQTDGMEFASEMVISATLAELKRTEVPTTLYPDGRSRAPHLRTWRDGWRHLRFMLLYSPRWLFLYPSILFMTLGGVISLATVFGPLEIGDVVLDVHTLLGGVTMLIVGIQLLLTGLFARAYTTQAGILPPSERLEHFIETFSLGWGLFVGLMLAVVGVGFYGAAVLQWSAAEFSALDYQSVLRVVISGTFFVIVGLQLFFWSFVMSLFTLKVSER